MLTFEGICLQNRAKARACSSSSLIPSQMTYSYVTFLLVLSYQYFSASAKSSMGLNSLIGISLLRVSLMAEWRDSARLNLTSSSASFLIILAMPTVERVILLGAI